MEFPGINIQAGACGDSDTGSPGDKARQKYRTQREEDCFDAFEDFAESLTRRHL
jgi:hypothetical protein